MILGFKKQFVDKIRLGEKTHTIRLDKHDRWKAGKRIQFATGVRTKKYRQFYEGECKSTQTISINYDHGFNVFIDDEMLLWGEIEALAKNDGFDNVNDFRNWFNKDFSGKIIHWTNFRYL